MSFSHFWTSLYESASTVFGVLFGLVAGALLCLVFSIVIHPIGTYFWRFVYGDHKRAKEVVGDNPDGPDFVKAQPGFALVLSDLHIDTWDEPVRDKRKEDLRSILKWADGNVQRLILNGDLLDAPPHPNNQRDPTFLRIPKGWPTTEDVADSENLHDPNDKIVPGVIQARFEDTLADLHQTKVPTVGTVGNHDIGINGLRTVLTKFKQANWVPGILFDTGKDDDVVFMEHGHLIDPVLWVYIVYSLIDLFLRGDSATSGQRGGRIGKAGDSTKSADQVDLFKSRFNSPSQHKFDIGIFERITRFSYRMAAYRRHRELKLRFRRHNIKVVAIMMGHTHIPDRFQLDGETVYLNVGDWAGNKDHQTFAVIYDDGTVVGPQRWDKTLADC